MTTGGSATHVTPEDPVRRRARVARRLALTDAADARTLTVDTRGLPDADGSYEVWLLDLDDGRLVALGTLDEAGRGRLTVPDGVDLSDYPAVDVSLEPDDGDPGHSGNSVLRGALPA